MGTRPSPQIVGESTGPAMSRRRLLRAGVAVVGLPSLLRAAGSARRVVAGRQIATPTSNAASPAPGGVAASGAEQAVGPPLAAVDPAAAERLAPFLALSTALVGGGGLDQRRAAQYLAIIAPDAAKSAALDELLALADPNPATIATPVAAASSAARGLGREILMFWYLGMVAEQPVTDRGDAWFGLSAWQAVGYTPAPSACKGFGTWATAPPAQG